MSMLSRLTMGAMASKNASESSPVRPRTASLRAGEVRGPVAMITDAQSSGGRPAISVRSTVISGWPVIRPSTAVENPTRSTAKAEPAGTRWASPQARITDPHRRISACRRPTALWAASSERKELEQTSSARPSV